MWRNPKYGEVLHTRYRKKYKKEADEEEDKDADGVDPFEKEGGEDQAGEDQTDASRGVLLQHKLCLTLAYFEELSGDEKTGFAEAREEDFETRRKVYESALKGEVECSVAELDESVFLNSSIPNCSPSSGVSSMWRLSHTEPWRPFARR
jgi:hypothetical protein